MVSLFAADQKTKKTKRMIDFAKFAKSVPYQARTLYKLGIKTPEIAEILGLSQCRIREIVKYYPLKSSRRKAHLWRNFLGYEV
mgnify:CR=1 FL=1